MIDTSNYDKADVLRVLYNRTKPQGLGFLQYTPGDMTRKEAEGLLQKHTYFGYVRGRVMKVGLKGDTLDPWLYDRDNGQGAAQCAINSLQGKETKR